MVADDKHEGDSVGRSSVDNARPTDESADWSSSVSEKYVEGVCDTATGDEVSQGKTAGGTC